MKNLCPFICGALLMALIGVSIFCYALYNGKVASAQQACVQHVPVDYLTAITSKR